MEIIKRQNYSIEVGDPIKYVDNEKRKRSGHMTHGLAEFAPGAIIDFNSNCSDKRCDGHSTFGWVEYRISRDGGETFGEIKQLPYSIECFLDGIHVISVEKAVACPDGTIVAFCLRNNAKSVCQPWNTPMVVISRDEGETWSEAKELCRFKGRVYDACYHDGAIYALEFCNDGTGSFLGTNKGARFYGDDEHLYRIYKSTDNGESFEELCVVPTPVLSRAYGAMLFDDAGRLHVYTYNFADERHIDHIVSEDGGVSWGEPTTSYLAKGIRNPQIAQMDGIYLLHGRAEMSTGFVLYSSEDGFTFDEGTTIGFVEETCYYSNNLVLKDKDGGNRMLMQYSESYAGDRVNVMHRWVKILK